MLVEKKLSEALKDYDKGKKVIVMSVMCDGSMSCDLLDELLGNCETHFLVDVPAYENPEFEAAVHNMVSPKHKESVAPVENTEPEACGGGTPKEEKSSKEIGEELALQGLSNREIADKTGISYQTVWKYAKDVRKEKEQESFPGWNADRQKCTTCQYRGQKNKNGCDYLSYEGHSRGCKVEDCDKYVMCDRLPLDNKLQIAEE